MCLPSQGRAVQGGCLYPIFTRQTIDIVGKSRGTRNVTADSRRL